MNKRAWIQRSLAVLMAAAVGTVWADVRVLDDHIVTGSQCLGFDCMNGEAFTFDTLRLKENNLRIHIADTSSSSNFPTNDWRLEFNSSANGGGNYVRILDASSGRMPWTLEAGAPSHAFYLDQQGRLGLGTSTPMMDLHLISGDSATLRLEQDTSLGFGQQSWDLLGNEQGFFVRNVNANSLPLRISTTGDLQMAGQVCANRDGTPQCIGSVASSRALKEVLAGVDAADILQRVRELGISLWRYKTDADDVRHIGPMAEQFHALFGLNGDADHEIATVDLTGVTLASIQAMAEDLERKDAQIQQLRAEIEQLRQLILTR